MLNHTIDIPTEEEFDRFQRLIEDKLGIHLARTKSALLGNRLWKRLEKTGCHNFSEYFAFINHPEHQDELEKTLELITTNETYFFREENHFDFLIEQVVPQFNFYRPLRIWSAACSSGEEPYSIAISMIENRAPNWQLIASDVNKQVLEKAKQGVYLNHRLNNVPQSSFNKYFMQGIDEYAGYVRLKPIIRERVQFVQQNLKQDFRHLDKFDVIFLRNVMIYFDLPTKSQLIEKMYEQLNPGGWLFIGHSESLHGVSSLLKNVKPSIYVKP